MLLRWIIHRLRLADRRRVDFYALDAMHRLTRLLIELAGGDHRVADVPVEIDLPLTQQELASLIGASRHSVVRALASLRRRGLIATDRGRVTILDIDQFRGRDGVGADVPDFGPLR